MLAAMNGHYECVQLLLDMGADINAQVRLRIISILIGFVCVGEQGFHM